MKQTDDRLVQWAIRQAKEKEPDISVLTVADGYRLEEDRWCRFVGHFISDAEDTGLTRTVLIGGVGHDFFQRSWASYEETADAKGLHLCTLADAELVYAKTEADRQRFLYLQARLREHLADFRYMYQRGLEWIGQAMDVYKSMLFETDVCKLRKGAGFVGVFLSQAVVCLNQTYFKNYAQIFAMEGELKFVPEGFFEKYRALSEISERKELLEHCHGMIAGVRMLFSAMDPREKAAEVADLAWLGQWYQECAYYFRKILRFCADGDAGVAFAECSFLQADLDDLTVRYGIEGLDLVGNFDGSDLKKCADQVKSVEARIVDFLEEKGVALDAYDSVEDFLARN